MEQEQAQQRHQQVELEDLVNDLLSPSSACVLTTADLPRRRHRQRTTSLPSPSPETSYTPPDSPLVLLLTTGTSRANSREHAHSRERAFSRKASSCPSPTTLPKHDSLRAPSRERAPSRAASKGPSPTTTSKHDSLRANSRRKLVSTHKWGNDSPLARSSGHGSPLPLAPQHRRVFSECTSTMRRAQTAEPLSQPAHPHILVEQLQQPQRSSRQLAVALARAPSRRNLTAGFARSVDLKAVAHTAIASLPMMTRNYTADLAVLEWEHRARLELKARQRADRARPEGQGGQERLELEAGRDEEEGVASWNVDLSIASSAQPFGRLGACKLGS
ncbi:hypothetical protein T484DRAFT_1838736 [Baffinella frigidus]|nr:hypothetical protein T484DRAFT_1838736 [Cryptophyta sp. CCMP2293]